MIKRDHYDILGISRTATPELIRAAHRVASRRYHPDTADDKKGDANLFAEIQEAYETLSNPDNRRRYDTKQGFSRGEFSAGGKRRPPKTPCGACGQPVYGSQLKLYLGRHICRECFDRKRQREINRPRLSPMGEMLWRLKCVRVWGQSHLALLLVIFFATVAVGARLISVANPPRRPDRPREATPAAPSAEVTTLSAAPLSNPCLVPPLTSSQTADIRSMPDNDK